MSIPAFKIAQPRAYHGIESASLLKLWCKPRAGQKRLKFKRANLSQCLNK